MFDPVLVLTPNFFTDCPVQFLEPSPSLSCCAETAITDMPGKTLYTMVTHLKQQTPALPHPHLHLKWEQNELTLYQTTNFQTVPNWRHLQMTNECDWQSEICVGMSRKHGGKRRKCWLPAFSPFPTVFSKAFFFLVVQSQDCVVKS